MEANMIIISKKYDLREPKTWDYMISKGVNIDKESEKNFILGL